MTFWEDIDTKLELLRSATTVDEVLAILPPEPGLSSGHGWFGGGGGDGRVEDSLWDAGWRSVIWEASYYWCMAAPNGDLLSYVEGDLYRGNKLTEWSN